MEKEKEVGIFDEENSIFDHSQCYSTIDLAKEKPIYCDYNTCFGAVECLLECQV